MSALEDYFISGDIAIDEININEVLLTGFDPKLPASNSPETNSSPTSSLGYLSSQTAFEHGENVNLINFINDDDHGAGPFALERLQPTLIYTLENNNPIIDSSYLDVNNINEGMADMGDIEELVNVDPNLVITDESLSYSHMGPETVKGTTMEETTSSSVSITSEDTPGKVRRPRRKKEKMYEKKINPEENEDSIKKIQRAKDAKKNRDKHKLEVDMLKQKVSDMESLAKDHEKLQKEHVILEKSEKIKDQLILTLTEKNNFLAAEVSRLELEVLKNSKSPVDENERKCIVGEIKKFASLDPAVPFELSAELTEVLSNGDLKEIVEVKLKNNSEAVPKPRIVTTKIYFGIQSQSDKLQQ